MDRLTLERHQVWLYLSAILLGLSSGTAWPAIKPGCEALLWPGLILLLYSAFVQVPLLHIRAAFADYRFVVSVLAGNFIVMPLVVWGLVQWLPPDPMLRLGVLLVLLVPCTDWFISFSQLGGGNVPRAVAVTPINLLLQILLMPGYLWLMTGIELGTVLTSVEIGSALLIVLLPLGLAALSEYWMELRSQCSAFRERMAWWPVPLLSLVVFVIAATQEVTAIIAAAGWLVLVVPIFIAYLFSAALVAKGLAVLMQLQAAQGRTLAFSLGTRNSFVVLPFALSLPQGWETVALVIIVQSLVELFGMTVYLWWLPSRLFPSVKQ